MHPVKSDSDEPSEASNRAGFDGGGGGGYDGSMRERITKLEAFAAEAFRRFDRLEAICDRLERTCERLEAEIKSIRQDLNDYRIETKRDIDNAIRWIVGVMFAISMAAITIVTFVLNYATPKTVSAPQPIVIYATAPPAGQAAVVPP